MHHHDVHIDTVSGVYDAVVFVAIPIVDIPANIYTVTKHSDGKTHNI